ncbi:Receptor-interacting serine/threonine-protein kinase 1 [Branchiostoma belcheri]|nr:Receptor-interacting serine/threonine-protein kinase 1 [Branchiostoma belcheri]
MPNASQDVTVLESKSLTVGETLGRGAFGTVFKAKHKHLGVVAVKLAYSRSDLDGRNELDMRQEVAMMNQLNCDHVVRLLGIVLEPGKYCLVVQYMRYGGLAGFLTKLDIPWPLRFRMSFQIIQGMNYLHHMTPPVIHRDLKADNVLVDDAINVKIADLGLSTWKTWRSLSKLESKQRGEQPQHERQRIGTISHVAPECLQDPNRKQNEKSDVYSFGIVLWEILSRQLVFGNALNSTTLAFGIVSGKRPDLQLIPPGSPSELVELMKKCWDQEPDRRPDFTGCKQAIEPVYDTSYEPDVDSAVIWTKQELQKMDKLVHHPGRGVYAQDSAQQDPLPSMETTVDQPPPTEPDAQDGEPPTISQTVVFEGQGQLNEAVADLSLTHSQSESDSSLTVDAELGTPSPPPTDEKKSFPASDRKEKPATGATGATGTTPVRATDQHDIRFNLQESSKYANKGEAQDCKGASAQEEGPQHPLLTSRGKGAKPITEHVQFTSPVESSEKNTSIPTAQQYAMPPRPQAGPFYATASGPPGHGQYQPAYLPAPGGYWYTPAPGMQPTFIPQGFPMPSWPQQGGGQGQNAPIFYQKQSSDGSTTVTMTMSNVEGVQIGDKNVMYVGGAQGPRSGGRHHPVRQGNITYRGKITESTRKVETRDIQAVQEGIGKHWKVLARQLGFLEGKIDTFDHDFDRDGLDEKVYQMLRKWSMEWGKDATLKALADALCSIGKADVAALLKD